MKLPGHRGKGGHHRTVTVTVTPGAANVVDVVAEKWAGREQDLDAIELEMLALQNGVRITATNPLKLNGVWVDVDATIPLDMRPRIEVGAGDIAYRGPAQGETLFATGAGNITLTLPAGVNVEVLLSVGSGTVRVDFPVVGQVNDHVVDGVIGTGADGRIVAQVGAGSIVVESE